jgi:hypothetical protein
MALTYEEKLIIIKNQAASIVSAALVTLGLDDFEKYLIGPPDVAEQRQFAVYLDQTLDDEPKEQFNVMIQAQLYNISPVDSYKYQQVINDFIKEFDPELIEEVTRGQILGDNWPVNENSSTIIIFSIRFETDVDDCNYDDSNV